MDRNPEENKSCTGVSIAIEAGSLASQRYVGGDDDPGTPLKRNESVLENTEQDIGHENVNCASNPPMTSNGSVLSPRANEQNNSNPCDSDDNNESNGETFHGLSQHTVDETANNPEIANIEEAESKCEGKTEEIDRIITPQTPLPFRRRFTPYLLFMGLASVFLVAFGIGILSFLWFGNQSATWNHIVISNWLTRTVTLTALAIRIAVTVQAGIATSMLASLIIEVSGLRLEHAPEISMMRLNNNGPQSLLWLYFFQPKQLGNAILLLGLLVTTLATQFTSTLLLSDIGSGDVVEAPISSNISYGFKTQTTTKDGLNFITDGLVLQELVLEQENYWSQTPTEFPSFGEYAFPTNKTDGVDDTGITLRAFLPFSDKRNRSSIRNYTGPGFVYDARVVCIAPHFHALERCGDSGERLCGMVAPGPSVVTQGLITGTDRTQFNCSLSRIVDCVPENILFIKGTKTCSDQAWTLCGLNASAGGLISTLDPMNNASLNHRWSSTHDLEHTYLGDSGNWIAADGAQEWPVDLGHAYLLFNFSLGDIGIYEPTNATLYNGAWADVFAQELREIDSEARYILKKSRASLCFDALPENIASKHNHDHAISVTADEPVEEPIATTFNGEFNTTGIRHQLGICPSKVTRRGAMWLNGTSLLKDVAERRTKWTPPKTTDVWANEYRQDTSNFNDATYSWVLSKSTSQVEGRALGFCKYCQTDLRVNLVQAAIFKDILLDTDSPALALQAYLTTLINMAYYSWLPLFDATAEAVTVQAVSRSLPTSTRGYWAVMAILITHILLCVVITILFARQTKYSLLGNAWSAFCQVANVDNLQQLIQDATLSSDKEVGRRLKAMEKETFRVVASGSDVGAALKVVPSEVLTARATK